MLTTKQKLDNLLLNPDSSKSWKTLRLIGHLVTLPFRIVKGIFCTTFKILPYRFADPPTLMERAALEALQEVDPKLQKNRANQVINLHIQAKYLCRSKIDGKYDSTSPTDRMMATINLMAFLANDADMCDKYEMFIADLCKNDFSLLEYSPPDRDDLKFLYDYNLAGLLEEERYPENIRMKVYSARYNPSALLSGEQALILLAALRICGKKFKAQAGRELYLKYLLLGYGWLGLFALPRTSAAERSIYILKELADNFLGRWFWGLAYKLNQRLASK